MQSLSRHLLVDLLHAAGFLQSTIPDSHALSQGVRAFQTAHGLTVDGWAGPQTRRALLDPLSHFCGVRESEGDADRPCRWPHTRIVWSTAGRLPHLSAGEQLGAFRLAWSFWEEVCGVEPHYTSDPGVADVILRAGGIDRTGGILAWSEMPCDPAPQLAGRRLPRKQLQIRFDMQETWVVSEQPARREIDLVRVAAHEIGHALGLPHLTEGALMAPAYNPSIRRPQTPDILEAVRRYGPAPDLSAAGAALTLNLCPSQCGNCFGLFP